MQWLRRATLIVAGAGREGLDLSRLRIQFKIGRSDAQSPNTAEIRVFNLAAPTAHLIRDEFRRVTLQAGYEGNVGVIFDGLIKQARIGAENGTDSILTLNAADGDRAYNFGVVSTTLAAGSTPADHLRAAAAGMEPHGVALGYVPDLPATKLARGKVIHGMARDHLRQATRSSGCTWSIQDGRVQVVPRTSFLPGTAVVLSSGTGLIGTPEQTDKGITARCLLNPNLRVGGLVKIEADIAEADRSTTASSGSAPAAPAELSSSGIYRLLAVDFVGDTFGSDWYADLTCLSVDQTAPAGEEVEEE